MKFVDISSNGAVIELGPADLRLIAKLCESACIGDQSDFEFVAIDALGAACEAAGLVMWTYFNSLDAEKCTLVGMRAYDAAEALRILTAPATGLTL